MFTQQRNLPLVEELRVSDLIGIREPDGVTPYGLIRGRGPDGQNYVALACAHAWDLDRLAYLVGLDVKVMPTENGLKLRPLDQQPEPTIETVIERLEASSVPVSEVSNSHQNDPIKVSPSDARCIESEVQPPINHSAENTMTSQLAALVTTVAETAIEKGIAIAAWVCIPEMRA